MIISVSRLDPQNVGDAHCNPFLYFGNSLGVRRVDIQGSPGNVDSGAVAVIGGGGLFIWVSAIQTLVERHRTILWGCGLNSHDNVHHDGYPDWVRNAALVGVRDWGVDLPWVPCPSCMSPLFDAPGSPSHDVVVYSHKNFPIPLSDFPAFKNDTSDLAAVLRFLSLGRTVITNTYHGAYWSLLLGRRVVIWEPFSSRFHHMRWQPPMCDRTDWRQKIADAVAVPEALAVCREANARYWERVREVLAEKTPAPGRSAPGASPPRIMVAQCAGGLGDVLYSLPALKALHRTYPASELGLLSAHPDLAPSWVRGFGLHRNIPWTKELDGFRADGWDVRDVTFAPWMGASIPIPYVFAEHVGVHAIPSDARDLLEIGTAHLDAAAKLAGPGPYIALQAGPCKTASWHLPQAQRQEIVNLLVRLGRRVVGVAHPRDGWRLSGMRPAFTADARVAAAVIRGASLYIGGDSGPSWLAVLEAGGTPKVILQRQDHKALDFQLGGDPSVTQVSDRLSFESFCGAIVGAVGRIQKCGAHR